EISPQSVQRLSPAKLSNLGEFDTSSSRFVPRACTHKSAPCKRGSYQPAETFTHRRHRLRRARRQFPIGPPCVFAVDVPVGRRQDESGSASFGISQCPLRFRKRPNCCVAAKRRCVPIPDSWNAAKLFARDHLRKNRCTTPKAG